MTVRSVILYNKLSKKPRSLPMSPGNPASISNCVQMFCLHTMLHLCPVVKLLEMLFFQIFCCCCCPSFLPELFLPLTSSFLQTYQAALLITSQDYPIQHTEVSEKLLVMADTILIRLPGPTFDTHRYIVKHGGSGNNLVWGKWRKN